MTHHSAVDELGQNDLVLAKDLIYEDLMTATSHLASKKINHFCHLHQNTDDLIKKAKMRACRF